MGAEYLANGLGANGSNNALRDELTGNLLAIPLGERASAGVGSLAGNLDGVCGDFRGEKTACVPNGAGRLVLQAAELGSESTIFGRYVLSFGVCVQFAGAERLGFVVE